MRSASTCDALSRLWVIHNYSLPAYLNYAPPAWKEEDGAAARLLESIHQDQQRLADRIGKMILEYGEVVPAGSFPNRFTAMHDLSSTFMWAVLQSYQQRTVEAIERLIPQLPDGTIARSLAQECLGAAKAHLDAIREVSSSKSHVPA